MIIDRVITAQLDTTYAGTLTADKAPQHAAARIHVPDEQGIEPSK